MLRLIHGPVQLRAQDIDFAFVFTGQSMVGLWNRILERIVDLGVIDEQVRITDIEGKGVTRHEGHTDRCPDTIVTRYARRTAFLARYRAFIVGNTLSSK